MTSVFGIIGVLPAIILVASGLLIRYKKAYWLISGYNTMSAEKKRKVDFEGLGKLMSNMCFALAAIISVSMALISFKQTLLGGIFFAFLIPVIIYTLIKAQKYDGNAVNAQGRLKPKAKVSLGLIIGLLAVVMIGVCALLYFSARPTEYALQDGSLKISGMYGQTVRVSEIKNLELRESIPDIVFKSNGSGLGNKCKGYFKLKDIGEVKLFVDLSKSPYIYFENGAEKIILNCEASDKTKALFNALSEELKSR